MKNTLLFLVAVLIYVGCESTFPPEKLLDETVRKISLAPDTITYYQTKANCHGPLGDYTTEVNSEATGYTYFKQVYTYRDSPFEAVAVSADSGFQILNDSMTQALDKPSISIIKGHEFHKILFELKKRYHGFQGIEEFNEGSSKLYKIKALDDLNNSVSIQIDKDSLRIRSLTFCNPGDTTELITVSYSDWRQVQNIKLPMRVSIQQGKEKVFSFSYISVKIGSKNFKRWAGKEN